MPRIEASVEIPAHISNTISLDNQMVILKGLRLHEF